MALSKVVILTIGALVACAVTLSLLAGSYSTVLLPSAGLDFHYFDNLLAFQLLYLLPVDQEVAYFNVVAGNGQPSPAGTKQSWQSWEDSFFRPLGGAGVKLTDAQRLRIDMSKNQLSQAQVDPVKAKKAQSWQSWEDSLFGHSQAAVAAHLLPPRHPKNVLARKKGKKSLVDQIADKSWVSTAEVDNVDNHKVRALPFDRLFFFQTATSLP